MKQLLPFLAAWLITPLFSTLMGQNFILTPEKPLPGETLTVRYDPAGTPLEKAASFDAMVFLFDFDQNDQPIAQDLTLVKENGIFSASVPTTKTTKALLFGFYQLENEIIDDNGGKGYKTLFYESNRQTPVAEAYAAKALIYGGFGSRAGIKSDPEKALSLMKKEFENHPASKQKTQYFNQYAGWGNRLNDESVVAEAKARIADLTSGKKVTEKNLNDALALANFMRDNDRASEIEQQMKKQFPNSKAAMNDLVKSFNESKELADKVAVYEKIRKNHGSDKDAKATIGRLAGRLASAYSDKEDWTNFDKYLAQVNNKAQMAGSLNSIAWKMSGESIEAEGKDLERAKALSMRSLKMLEDEKVEMADKPASITPKQYKYNLGYSVAMYADTYALLAYKTGDKEKALEYQQMACDKNKFKDGEMNERYCVYYEHVKGSAEAEKLLARLIGEGKANSAMKAHHKRLFLANNSLESAYDKYAVQLEAAAKASKREEIRKKMIEQPAPDFKLVNLKGEEVSLSGLRGKVVVVDFWATWCGPCIASFPGMQRAADHFAEAGDVEFLFIDTWESAKDKVKNASDFIEKKNYRFNVLMDLEDKTVAAYGVTGIPTKFVVDKNGVIRFKSIGFGGNDEDLVHELVTMIGLAGGSVPMALAEQP